MINNTERQRRLRQRRKEAGLVDYRRAVTPDQAKALDEFIRDAEKLDQWHNELAALKAQCQAEAARDGFIRGYFYYRQCGFQFEEELNSAADRYAKSIIKSAQEPSNANPNNPPA